jgi:hypothetical protein
VPELLIGRKELGRWTGPEGPVTQRCSRHILGAMQWNGRESGEIREFGPQNGRERGQDEGSCAME